MNHRFCQRGSVLIISLMIMLLMTLISVTAMRTTVVEQKMAGNTRDQTIALAAAEAALKAGEAYIETITTVGGFGTGSNGLYEEGSNPNPLLDATWTNANVHNGYTDVPSAYQPRYIIEVLPSTTTEQGSLNIVNYGQSTGEGAIRNFRITARGQGKSGGSYVFVQTNYGRAM